MVGKIIVAGAIPTHRIFLKAVLTAASYRVVEATEPGELLQIADTQRPDMIVLDASSENRAWVNAMSDCNLGRSKQIPVLAIERDYSPASRLFWLAAGANEIVAAPINETILRARVRNLLRAHALQTEAIERASTASELGFSEPPAPFQQTSRVLVASLGGQIPDALGKALDLGPGKKTEVIEAQDLLVRADCPVRAPDLIVLCPQLIPDRSALTAISEIRSRQWSRNASIVIMYEPADRLAAISALDLGANDAIEADSEAEEIRIRFHEQLRQKQMADAMRKTLDRGFELASTDPLTGLYNRRYALPHLHRIAATAAQSGKPYSALVLDLDWFKSINDQFGHAAGDIVLTTVAERLRQNVRTADLVARIGGEEFLIIMPETDITAAKLGAERLRQVIAADPVAIGPGNKPIRVTASIGVASGNGYPPEDADELIERADRALYAAKGHGRNLVEAGKSAA